MALSDLAVYSEYAYDAFTEVQDQQIALFNAASDGTIVLRAAAHQGDFSDEAFFARVTGGTVRRRNAYGSGAITAKTMKQLVDTSVKVAAGTPQMILEPSNYKWIQLNPQMAGAAFGQQLAQDAMADMLNVALGSVVSALTNVTGNILDISGGTGAAAKMSFIAQAQAAQLMGDRSAAIRAWVMHSSPQTDLFINALTNNERLFSYGTVNVNRDAFGRVYVITDSPSLMYTAGGGGFNSVGLQGGAIYVGQNNDFEAMEENITGKENLQKAYQAEWSYQVGVQGFSWDKASGGKSPNDAALFTAANWDRYATSHKDLAGVLVKSK